MTSILAWAVTPPKLTIIVAVPTDFPVTTPVVETVAMEESELDQLSLTPSNSPPLVLFTVAITC